MTKLTRRGFLLGSAALAAAPALGAVPASGHVDVIVVGAGAAGIAATRRLAAAGKSFALIEAASRTGGRCVTDMRSFGVPFDRGANWLHGPDTNPLAKLAPTTGLDLYDAPPGQRLRIGPRNARANEMEDFLAALVRSGGAIAEAGRAKDVAAVRALPDDLGDLRAVIAFALGPYACGKDLADVSAADLAHLARRDRAAFCRQGVGALLAALAKRLPVQLSTAATQIDWGARAAVEVSTPKGRLSARAVIVTVSTGVLGTDAIRFRPALPKRTADAVARLSPGSYDRIALELDDNPLRLQSDDLVLQKANDERTAALLANVAGTPLCLVDVAGRFGRSLAAEGEAAMAAFAVDWLVKLYGADVRRAVKRSKATQWNRDRLVRGATSVAVPGGQGGRRVLAEPLGDRVWFAGEAVHETLWGTLGGAWDSGERAAEAALKQLDAPPPPVRAKAAKPKKARPAKRKRRRRR